MPKPKKSKPKPPAKSHAEPPAGSCEVVISARLDRQLRKLSAKDVASIEETMKAVGKAFGHPHRHSGLGIRDLGGAKSLYECRWSGSGRGGLELRLVFLKMSSRPTTLYFEMLGDHAEVAKFLKK